MFDFILIGEFVPQGDNVRTVVETFHHSKNGCFRQKINLCKRLSVSEVVLMNDDVGVKFQKNVFGS